MSAITHPPHGGIRRRSSRSRTSARAHAGTAVQAGEAGFTIVEVLVSALVVVMVALATFGAITTAGRATSETRHRAQAYGIAQQDQARMRTFKVSNLSNYSATSTVTVDNTPYTVVSQGEFVTDSTGTQTCSGSASPDYISISSTITWPSMGSRPSVVMKSIVSPPNGSIAADRGALAVKAVTSRNLPLSGVRITGSGPAAFTDVTDVNGCVLFGNLPAGSYSLTPSSSTTIVDKNGDAPKVQATSVVAQSTNTLTLQYDRPGTIPTTFTTRQAPNGTIVASSADTVMVFNSGMTVAKKFGTVGTRLATVNATPLFPFVSPDTVYAGACVGNNPTAAAPLAPLAANSVAVPVNGTVAASVQIPALYLPVMSGTSSAVPGTPVVNGRVTITDRNCANVKRIAATNATGNLADPGLPYSAYDICADNGTRRQTASNVAVKDLAVGTSLAMYLSGTGSVAGTCP
jgi:Tfp pilus assembly protein PilV